MNTTDVTHPEQVDARIKREAEIAEAARKQRADSAKAKRQAAKPKPKPAAKPVAKQAGSMAEFVDNLLMQGVKWHYLEMKCKEEAARRKVKTFASLGQIKAHVKYRSTQAKFKVTDVKGTVKMVLVEKAAQAKAKPAAKKPAKMTLTSPAKMGAARKTGKAVGRRVEKPTENGRQTVTEQPAKPEQAV